MSSHSLDTILRGLVGCSHEVVTLTLSGARSQIHHATLEQLILIEKALESGITLDDFSPLSKNPAGLTIPQEPIVATVSETHSEPVVTRVLPSKKVSTFTAAKKSTPSVSPPQAGPAVRTFAPAKPSLRSPQPTGLSAPVPSLSFPRTKPVKTLADVRKPFIALSTPRRTLAIASVSGALCVALGVSFITAIKPTNPEFGQVAGVSTEKPSIPTGTSLPTPANPAVTQGWETFTDQDFGITFDYPSQATNLQVSASGTTVSVTDSAGLLIRITKLDLAQGEDISARLQSMEQDSRRQYRFANTTIGGLSGRVGTSITDSSDASSLYLLGKSTKRGDASVYQVAVRRATPANGFEVAPLTRIVSSFSSEL